jgi:uncharacterized protein
MRYRCVLIAALAASASAQGPIPPTRLPNDVDPARVAAIEELFLLTKPEQMQRQALPQFQASFMADFERQFLDPLLQPIDRSKLAADLHDFEEQIMSVIADRVNFEKHRAEFVRMYAETFTADEINGMVAFYRSPAGEALLRKQSALATKGLALAQQQVQDAMPDIQKMTEPWVENMKKKYGPTK